MIQLFKGYPEGSNLTLLNTIYHYPSKDPETGKWSKGAITLIAKDVDANKKIVTTIDNPAYEFYMAKPTEVLDDYNYFFYDKDKLDLIECPYNDLDKTIAKLTNNLDFYYDNLKSGRRGDNKFLHADNRIFRSDMNISDFYRYKFARMYKNDTYVLRKGYFDIEEDTINMKGDFPEPGECPINAVTFIDMGNKQSYTFILENDKNPLIAKFKAELGPDKIDKLRGVITDIVGAKKMNKFKIDQLNYNFLFYKEEEEINMLADLFAMINNSEVDFMLAWNMAFDVPHIMARIQALGYDPKDIMCHQSFKYKECKYYVDERNLNEFAERGDKSTLSSLSVFIDQMVQFASRRKGQSQFPSFKLNDIAYIVAGVHKYDYSHITTSIAKFPWLDFESFIFYNIVDVICQVCIEEKVNDIDYIFAKALANNTRYSKIHRQTVYLVNGANETFEDLGYICGNNTNKIFEIEKPRFPGAYVSNPIFLGDYSKRKLNGVPILAFDNCDDFDYTRLYPSETNNFNMAPNTQLGKIDIPEPCFENDSYLNDKVNSISERKFPYNRGGAFVEDMSSRNWIIFGNRWLHLANYNELIEDVNNYYTLERVTNRDLYDLKHNIIEKNYKPDAINYPFSVLDGEYTGGATNELPFTILTEVPVSVKERLINEFNNIRAF